MGIKIRLKQLNESVTADDGRTALDPDNKPVNPSSEQVIKKVVDQTVDASNNTNQVIQNSSTLFPKDKNVEDYRLYSKFIERLNQK